MELPRNPQLAKAQAVAQRLTAAGATDCMLVGGFVRDYLMGIPSKDIDLEVYGLGYDQIVRILQPHYAVDLVGRSFGVVKLDNQIDISIPRRESKCGVGHREFEVRPDPTMTPQEACARRDFTINAMGMRFSGEIFDPYNGRRDLAQKILRATTAAFKEDPLRVLRGMQFAARFGFEMAPATLEMCRELAGEFQFLSEERIWEEWRKWAAKGRHLSAGLSLLEKTGWIDHFPVLRQMRETPQDPTWHPEGDVFVHTALACDEAAAICEREGFSSTDRTIVVFAVLCHDFGKVGTTVRNESGRLIAPEHAAQGTALAKAFLTAMRAPGWLIEAVLPLVREHMAMLGYPKDVPPSARVVRRLARRLHPATMRLWSAVCESDASGRPPRPKKNPVVLWTEMAGQLALKDGQPMPMLRGRHLLPLGYAPGPELGAILKSAFEAQLDGAFGDVEEGVQWVRANHRVCCGEPSAESDSA